MRKKHPVKYLLEIPIEILFYAIAVGLAAHADAWIFGVGKVPAPEKEPFPYVTTVIFFGGAAVLVVAVAWSIVKFVKATVQRRKKKRAAREAMNGEGNE